MRKIESGSIRMSKPLGAIAPLFKPSVPLLSGGCTVLSIQPSTSILSEKALAALKYAFLQNKKVGIAGVRVDSLKPPCDSELKKAEAAYSIARELVEWSEQFIVDEFTPLKLDACLETQDDHKMNDNDAGYGVDSKDDNEYILKTKMFGDLKDPEIKTEIEDPEVKLELDDLESCSKLPYLEQSFSLMPLKNEFAPPFYFENNNARRLPVASTSTDFTALTSSKAAETLDFLKDTGCDSFDFFKSEDTDFNFLSVSSIEPLDSLDDLTECKVDIGVAFPVPSLPVFSKMDPDPELSSPIASPQSPFLFSPLSTSPHSPFSSFPDS